MVLEKYSKLPKLREENAIGKLAVKLAKESFIGDEVLRQYTVMGCRNFPSLPLHEINEPKQIVFFLFPNYWSNPVEFETKIWNQLLTPWANCARDSEMKTIL